MVVLALFALAAMAGAVCPADGQQDSVTSGAVECAPGMNTKKCKAAQLDALFKKMEQASAATAALDARAQQSGIQVHVGHSNCGDAKLVAPRWVTQRGVQGPYRATTWWQGRECYGRPVAPMTRPGVVRL
jgi:hypothetical protein